MQKELLNSLMYLHDDIALLRALISQQADGVLHLEEEELAGLVAALRRLERTVENLSAKCAAEAANLNLSDHLATT